MENILKNIENVRREKGKKQAVVAEALGVSQSAYSNYITRNDDIPFKRLSRIADILDVRVIDIITYPKKYVDIESIKESPERISITFEVSTDKKDDLLRMIDENRNNVNN